MSSQENTQFASQAVPMDQRMKTTTLFGTMAGLVFMTTSLQTGATMGSMSDFATVIKAIIIGALILAAIAVIMAVAASKSGMTFAMLCAYAYGKWGAKVVAFCIALSLLGWTAVDAGLMASAICSFVPQIPYTLMAVVCCVLFMLTAMFGMKVMSKLGTICVPFVGIFGVVSMVLGFRSLAEGTGIFAYMPDTQAGLGALVGLTIGSWIGIACSVLPDVIRFAKSTKTAIALVLLFMLVFNPLMLIIGAVAASATASGDFPAILVIQGLAIPGLFIGIFGNWGPAQGNLFSCGMSWSNTFRIKSHKIAVLICGVLAIVLAAINFYAYFGSFLIVLSNCVPAIIGVFIIDFLYTYRKGYPEYVAIKFRGDWRGIVSMGLGIVVAMIATYAVPQMGIPSIWGLCVAMAARLILVSAGSRSPKNTY